MARSFGIDDHEDGAGVEGLADGAGVEGLADGAGVEGLPDGAGVEGLGDGADAVGAGVVGVADGAGVVGAMEGSCDGNKVEGASDGLEVDGLCWLIEVVTTDARVTKSTSCRQVPSTFSTPNDNAKEPAPLLGTSGQDVVVSPHMGKSERNTVISVANSASVVTPNCLVQKQVELSVFKLRIPDPISVTMVLDFMFSQVAEEEPVCRRNLHQRD